jgi:hypothetical protein
MGCPYWHSFSLLRPSHDCPNKSKITRRCGCFYTTTTLHFELANKQLRRLLGIESGSTHYCRKAKTYGSEKKANEVRIPRHSSFLLIPFLIKLYLV